MSALPRARAPHATGDAAQGLLSSPAAFPAARVVAAPKTRESEFPSSASETPRVAPTPRLAGPLRSQNRPRIGRGGRDVARVRGAPRCIGAPPALAKKLLCDYNVSTRSLTAMKVELVRVGNSRGIRIPKPIIEQCGFEDAVELRIENDHLVIAPARQPREGWEEAFCAAGSSAHDELLLGTPSSQFDREEWRW